MVSMAINVRRGLELLDEYKIHVPSEALLFDGEMSQVEHLFHEAMHALSLGYDPRIAGHDHNGYLDRAITGRDDNGILEEARVLAAEKIVFPMLGVIVDPGEIYAAAEVQGIEPNVLDVAIAMKGTSALVDLTVAWGLRVGLIVPKRGARGVGAPRNP